MANVGICNTCEKLVPVTHREVEGKEYLAKHCPDCGVTTSLISSDSKRYRHKRDIMAGIHYPGCHMNCLQCTHKAPNLVFIETTNRCNMNCPICLTNVPAMKFSFEPDMTFFDKIFKHYSVARPCPDIQLFGGEPTMREDLFDIIQLAQTYGFRVRLVTNGLKLADPDYARRIVRSGVVTHISFDGFQKGMYSKLRGHPEAFDLKQKALENIAQLRKEGKKARTVLMSVVDKHINGSDLSHLLDYCHDHEHIRGIFLMPLTHMWSEDKLDYKPERTTQEDVEYLVSQALGTQVEFVPFGVWAVLRNIAKILDLQDPVFAGIHANCESTACLLHRGDRYVPLSVCFKHGLAALIADLNVLNTRVARHASKPSGAWLRLRVIAALGVIVFKHLNFGALVGARGLTALGRWMSIIGKVLVGRSPKRVLRKETVLSKALHVIVLPFEDDCTLESERLKECTACFGYVDVATDTVKSIPVCHWEKYKNGILREIAEKYNKSKHDGTLDRDVEEA